MNNLLKDLKKINRELELNNLIPRNFVIASNAELKLLERKGVIKLKNNYIKLVDTDVEIINCPNWFNYNVTRY